MSKNTTLWSIGCIFTQTSATVQVSENTLPNEILKIRAITPRAAARRYIKGNLAASHGKDYARSAIIQVIK